MGYISQAIYITNFSNNKCDHHTDLWCQVFVPFELGGWLAGWLVFNGTFDRPYDFLLVFHCTRD